MTETHQTIDEAVRTVRERLYRLHPDYQRYFTVTHDGWCVLVFMIGQSDHRQIRIDPFAVLVIKDSGMMIEHIVAELWHRRRVR